MSVKKVLFVCTGNSCRSVMAEGLLKKLLKEKGMTDVHVLSAGTHALTGVPPAAETVEVMRALGMDVSTHRGQPVTPELIRHADVIFCMEEFHRDHILAIDPQAAEKVHLLKAFGNPPGEREPNIPDPIGLPAAVYAMCLTTIGEAVERVVEWLQASRKEA